MKNTVVFEGGVDGIRTMVDSSLKVTLGTPELSPETMARLFGLLKQPGYIVISTSPVQKEMVDLVETAGQEAEFETKTPSQRMRNVIYRLWEKEQPREMNPEGVSTIVEFDLYYRRKMNNIIEHLKSKID